MCLTEASQAIKITSFTVLNPLFSQSQRLGSVKTDLSRVLGELPMPKKKKNYLHPPNPHHVTITKKSCCPCCTFFFSRATSYRKIISLPTPFCKHPSSLANECHEEGAIGENPAWEQLFLKALLFLKLSISKRYPSLLPARLCCLFPSDD